MVEGMSRLAARSLAGGSGGGAGARTVYTELRTRILRGALTPGMPLVEGAVAREFGVSRSPVREALGHLVSEGLLERRDRALQVAVLQAEDILDLFEVRIALERAAGLAAAERRTELDLARLDRSVEEMRRLRPDESARRAGPAYEFHVAVWLAAHNRTLAETLEGVRVRVAALAPTTLHHDDRWEEFLDGCEEIVEAVRRRDVQAAGDLAEAHMVRARDFRLRLLTAGGDPEFP